MTHDILIEICGFTIAFLAGWLLRGGLTDRRAQAEFSRGKYEGYHECLAIIEPAKKPEKPQLWRAK